jgi:hypothetical protein
MQAEHERTPTLKRGLYKDALSHYRFAVTLFEKQTDADPDESLSVLRNMGLFFSLPRFDASFFI